jgi:hypothetical protein
MEWDFGKSSDQANEAKGLTLSSVANLSRGSSGGSSASCHGAPHMNPASFAALGMHGGVSAPPAGTSGENGKTTWTGKSGRRFVVTGNAQAPVARATSPAPWQPQFGAQPLPAPRPSLPVRLPTPSPQSGDLAGNLHPEHKQTNLQQLSFGGGTEQQQQQLATSCTQQLQGPQPQQQQEHALLLQRRQQHMVHHMRETVHTKASPARMPSELALPRTQTPDGRLGTLVTRGRFKVGDSPPARVDFKRTPASLAFGNASFKPRKFSISTSTSSFASRSTLCNGTLQPVQRSPGTTTGCPPTHMQQKSILLDLSSLDTVCHAAKAATHQLQVAQAASVRIGNAPTDVKSTTFAQDALSDMLTILEARLDTLHKEHNMLVYHNHQLRDWLEASQQRGSV